MIIPIQFTLIDKNVLYSCTKVVYMNEACTYLLQLLLIQLFGTKIYFND
jgi:hypothetical protein